ncbi:hypothetical protein BgiBS90_014443 [Biomphalaria glabrata]|nr:hypothetical protein BgiBS90_014443 [Biomphalaria glabrata]
MIISFRAAHGLSKLLQDRHGLLPISWDCEISETWSELQSFCFLFKLFDDRVIAMKIILFLVAATLAATCAQRNSAASISKNHPAVQFALATINNFYAAKGDDAPRVFIGLVAFRSKNFFDRQIDLTVKVDNGIQIERLDPFAQSEKLRAS